MAGIDLLSKEIEDVTGCTTQKAERATSRIFNMIKAYVLDKGKTITIRGFGTFKSVKRGGYEKDAFGKHFSVPKYQTMKFKASPKTRSPK